MNHANRRSSDLRRMRQPRKYVLSDQLAAAADEIIRLRVSIALLCALPRLQRAPWLRRLYLRVRGTPKDSE